MFITETATIGRSGQVAEFFRGMETKKVAFTDWENCLVEGTANRFPQWNTVALNSSEEVTAAIVGGEALGHSSISHMAVSRTHRRGGLGSELVSHTVRHALPRSAASRIHLVVTAENEEALPFWARHGFEISSEPVVELTVPSADTPVCRNEMVQELDVTTIRPLFQSDPVLRARLSSRERSAIAADLSSGRARGWSVRQGGNHTAMLFSASLGVRGIVRLFALREESDRDACAAMVTSGIAHIASQGVLRLHSFPKTEREKMLLDDAGFRVQQGETTMVRPM